MEARFDVGIVCSMNYNLGNNLTNYAMYCYLKDKGYKVGMIDVPYESVYYRLLRKKSPALCFLENPYADQEILRGRDKWELYEHTDSFQVYMVASDQLWRDYFVANTDYFTLLDWVPSYKYKFSYGTSIGTDSYELCERDDYHTSFLLHRFGRISVREISAQKLLENKWKLESQVVMDPVFMCNLSNFDRLAQKGMKRTLKEKYTAMYFLDVAEQKEIAGVTFANHLSNGRYMAMTEIIYKNVKSDKLVYTLQPRVEEWLSMIKNAEFVITDSFHGMCVAIIYQKPFCVFFNKENVRGYSRFVDLLPLLGLEDRLVSSVEEIDFDKRRWEEIDYQVISNRLNNMKAQSERWIESVLKEAFGIKGEDDTYGCFLRAEYMRVCEEKKRAKLFAAQANKLRRLSMKPYANSEDVQIVGWGIGNGFKKNIKQILEHCEMKYVCDRNAAMWGKEVVPGVICISPEELSLFDNVLVLITVERITMLEEIERDLRFMGIDRYRYVDEWLNEIKGESKA